ncbi:hypothetical protein E2C01_014769 [Portunus trituberculatus]|uniref:Uncharacterized protein n=1 Tax=Portunus trituberculatus TaxID=210409 RepID=A0A5B7DL72_PORTR|nr:hypothetical protein [Portunus trituberculatus]
MISTLYIAKTLIRIKLLISEDFENCGNSPLYHFDAVLLVIPVYRMVVRITIVLPQSRDNNNILRSVGSF